MKKILAIVAVFLLAGCATEGRTAPKTEDGTFKAGVNSTVEWVNGTYCLFFWQDYKLVDVECNFG